MSERETAPLKSYYSEYRPKLEGWLITWIGIDAAGGVFCQIENHMLSLIALLESEGYVKMEVKID